MTLAVTSIQRNRAPWLMEWLAFHLVVGVDRFFLYTHKCTDGSTELLQRLSRHYPIIVHAFDAPRQAQLIAYQHACNSYGTQVDWMAFIDGDEFLFPMQADTLGEALRPFESQPLSALAVYWMCYGSSGHLDEPGGLILEQFTRHAPVDFGPNRHVKSIVRGADQPLTIDASHKFATPNGTFDELLRPVHHGHMGDVGPSYQHLRLNHYVTQSWQYFKDTKQSIGDADRDPSRIRPDVWFHVHDRNDCDDGLRWRFLLAVKRKMREMEERLVADRVAAAG